MLYHGTAMHRCAQISSAGALLSRERQTGIREDEYRSTHVFLTPHPTLAYHWGEKQDKSVVLLGFPIRRIMIPDQVPLELLADVIIVSPSETDIAVAMALFGKYHPDFRHCRSERELERRTLPQ